MKKCLFGLILIFFVFQARAASNLIIATNAVWKYLDDGSDQGASWIAPGFNDAAWLAGPAQLGYGDGDEATVVGFGPDGNNKFITTYFRHGFDVPNPGIYTVLTMRVRRDDGVIIYVNGAEVYRSNMPTGPVAFNTPAPATASDDGSTFQTTTLSPSVLVSGHNVIAAEIHQQSGTSSDISFELELLGSTDPVINNPPNVALTSPANDAFYNAPADILLAANASDPDGTISRVEFFAGNTKLGEDTTAPFNFSWSSVPVGSYALRAVATDNLNARATSAVVNVTVDVSSVPVLASVTPAPGDVSRLDQITTRFSEPVSGVEAADLLINGRPATEVTGSGAIYTFSFPPPPEGSVFVGWEGRHGIVDFENPPRPFDSYGAGATWQYNYTDTVAPVVAKLEPPAGATLRSLRTIGVTFDEPVSGVDASDLRVNGIAALRVTGVGAGPYQFEVVEPASPTVNVAWTTGHGIRDLARTPNAFTGSGWSYSLDTNAVFEGQVVINEIMYHPASERPEDEWIELRNRGTSAVNLTGWALKRGVNFTFPNNTPTLPAGGYLVVAAHLPSFVTKYPAVPNVIGGWTGRLGNSYDSVELEDAQGQRVDLIDYSDQGDWARRIETVGWDWTSDADGLGRSLELRQAALERNTGQNWESSRVADGTPGRANSAATNNLPPMILNAAHFPAIPRSTNAVSVTARIVDEQPVSLTVTLWYRDATTTTPGNFISVPMADNGLNNDGSAGDGVYGARLSPFGNRTIIEFYVQARDATGQSRTWPAPAQRGVGLVQEANALFQVDDEAYTGNQPVYRLIMAPADRNGLLNATDRIQHNATLITVEGADTQVRYNCDVRRRGASSFGSSPPTMKLNIPDDRLWKGKSSMNLNSVNTWAQVVGAAICAQAGMPAAYARAVQVRFNGVNESRSDSQQFGSYAHVEVANSEWTGIHLPEDPGGNLYSKRRPECGLLYQGPSPAPYINCAYEKESNRSENDWTDLMNLTFSLDPATTSDADYVRAVRQNINVEQWMRYFAVLFLLNYNETALATGVDDDYDLYRGEVDQRFILLVHDLDSIYGSAGNSPNDIFQATAVGTMARFLHRPEFEPLYYAEYRRLLAGPFATNNLLPLFDQYLGDWVPAGTITSMKNNALARLNYAASAVPPAPASVQATVAGEPVSPTYLNTATLTVGGQGVTQYRYRLDGGAFGPETPVGTPITLAGLPDGTHTVYVIGRDATGLWQSANSPTVSQTWAVLSSLRRVVLNEVLAANTSAVNHGGHFPDLIELYNPGNSTVDLGGLRLTDDINDPNKFVVPAGTTMAPGSYLVLYADNPDGTAGIHLGFALNQDGETLYLLDAASNGPHVLDFIEFGLQLPNLSVGRLPGGQWGLTTPTFGSANVAVATASPTTLKINEWLAAGAAPFLDDFIEIYNPVAQPVSLSGLFISDHPIGAPFRHGLTPLSFIDGFGYRSLIADGNAEAGANHLNFQLAQEWGEIAIVASDGSVLDWVSYGPQTAGISEGRAPNGSSRITPLAQPTPGVGNPVPPASVPPQLVSLVPYTQVWKYEQSGTDLGTTWKAPTYNDAAWPSGPGLLAGVRSGGILPEAVGTALTVANTKPTFYFRTRFTISDLTQLSGLQLTHIFDDGAVVYLNGTEIYRYNLPAGPISFGTLASANILDAVAVAPAPLPLTGAAVGVNDLAVEIHQSSLNSADITMGCKLEGVILTNNPGLAGIVINEVLANARTATNSDGTISDWVELYNPTNALVDLSGMSFTDQLTTPRRWTFPQGSIIPALGFRVVRFDPDLPASSNSVVSLNTGFGLKATGDSVYLFNRPSSGGELLDAITFGLQAPDWSIGRVPNGGNWTLTLPSAGAMNIAAVLGDPAQLKINEWMADPLSGSDWFEVYNPTPQPIALGGLHLTDDPANRLKYPIPARSYIASGLLGFQRFEADNSPANGADHVNFKLSAGGESLGITDAYGSFIDSLLFGPQALGVSEGRLPDGSANITTFPETPSPGESNFRPIPNVVINEVLTHSELPLEDAIELRNTSGAPVDIGGWYLSDARTFLTKFQIPDGTTIPANGFLVFYENQFNPRPGDPDSFSLSSAKGDHVYLSAAAGGVLTGYRAVVEFGPAENGVSFGRFDTSQGVQFVALSNRTFGQDNPNSIDQFRLGTGAANSYAKVGPVVISEIMYHPPDLDSNDNVTAEYIQLRNTSSSPVNLFDTGYRTNRWRLRDAVKFDFPAETVLPANGTLLVVSFDPVTNTAARAQFLFTYGLAPGTALVGPYQGKLDNSSDSIELLKPDQPQPPGSADPGYVAYILVERVHYADTAPWPAGADGTGLALHRTDAFLFGDDPVNWTAAPPLSRPPDRDNDGMPDSWELQYGLNPDNPNDATQDKDHDGLSNRDEYLAGTDPTSSSSVLALGVTSFAPLTLEFNAAANKSYTVEFRNDLTFGAWVPLTNVDPSPTPRVFRFSDNPLSTRFYRVRTPRVQ
ncbi:MAG TPA: lamin tail domain-containing protein [Verrucomicrobiae bacterium]|nr:lamin tail domain-containing protein [Verrucomicrobiae bacterium]